MCDLFKKYTLENKEKLSENRVNKIKYYVLSQIEEDFPMKKRFRLKPLVILVTAAITTIILAVTVAAAGSGQTPPYSVKVNGKDIPFTVEVTRGPNYQYTYDYTNETDTAYDVTTVIKYELPEEIVVKGSREVTDIQIETFTEDGYNIASCSTGISDYEIIYGLPFGVKKEYSKGQCSINIEYSKKKLARLKKAHP